MANKNLQPFEVSSETFIQASIGSENTTYISELEISDPTVDESISFTYKELQIFHDFARFLRPNPRHLKRLVNVYRLVRTLAKHKNELLILNNPDITICWLTMSGQWPYTTYGMLYLFEEMQERKTEGKLIEFPATDPLNYLFQKVNFKIAQDQKALVKQQRLDYDPDLLRMLLKGQEGKLSWKNLEVIRQYTINFNPAVGAELKAELPLDVLDDG